MIELTLIPNDFNHLTPKKELGGELFTSLFSLFIFAMKNNDLTREKELGYLPLSKIGVRTPVRPPFFDGRAARRAPRTPSMTEH